MFTYRTNILIALMMSSISLTSSCGKSGPDSKDEPTSMDKIRSKLFGKPLNHELDSLNKNFHGKINAADLNESEFQLKLFSIPSSINESKRHNLALYIVGEMIIDNKLFAITGRNSHINRLRGDGTHSALKSRQFIEFSPTTVMPSNFHETDVVLEPVKEIKDNNDSLNQKFVGTPPVISLHFIAELKDNNLVSGVILATRCPSSGGSCSEEYVGSWRTSETESSMPKIINNNSIQSETFTYSNLIDENIRSTLVKLNQ